MVNQLKIENFLKSSGWCVVEVNPLFKTYKNNNNLNLRITICKTGGVSIYILEDKPRRLYYNVDLFFSVKKCELVLNELGIL